MTTKKVHKAAVLGFLVITLCSSAVGQVNKKPQVSKIAQPQKKETKTREKAIEQVSIAKERISIIEDKLTQTNEQIANVNADLIELQKQKDSQTKNYGWEFWFLLITAISAIGTALFTLWIAIKTRDGVNENLRISKFLANFEMLYKTENDIYNSNNIDALIQLHGINRSDIDDIGVSLAEFEYINKSLKSSLTYYIIDGGKDKGISNYRKTFLSNPKVKSVYDLVKGKFLSNTQFIEIVDKYYEDNPV